MSYTMRKSRVFDAILWEEINTNSRFFYQAGYEVSLKLLSRERRGGMEELVRKKLEESKVWTLMTGIKRRRTVRRTTRFERIIYS